MSKIIDLNDKTNEESVVELNKVARRINEIFEKKKVNKDGENNRDFSKKG